MSKQYKTSKTKYLNPSEKQKVNTKYSLEDCCEKLREVYYEAKAADKWSAVLPTGLVGQISTWLSQLYNLKCEYAGCQEGLERFYALMQEAQDIYNQDGEPREKCTEIVRNLLEIKKQRSFDKKGLPYDDVQLFREYARTINGWSKHTIEGRQITKKELIAQKKLIIEALCKRYDIYSREAVIARLKKGKSERVKQIAEERKDLEAEIKEGATDLQESLNWLDEEINSFKGILPQN